MHHLFRRRKQEPKAESVEETAARIAKLTLTPSPRGSQTDRPNAYPVQQYRDEFVGGFHPEMPVPMYQEGNRSTKPLPTRPQSASPDSRVEFPQREGHAYSKSQASISQNNLPISMPVPYTAQYQPHSLTMQIAQGRLPPHQSSLAGQTLSPQQTESGLRPHSDSSVPLRSDFLDASPPRLKAQRPISQGRAPNSVPSKTASTQNDAFSTPVRPGRIHSVSSPPSPTASRSTAASLSGGIKVQCSGRTQKGLRCKNSITVSELAIQGDSDDDGEDDDPEFFCKVHESHVLSPKDIVIPQTSKRLACSGKQPYQVPEPTSDIKLDFIPDYLQPQTQASLRAQMQKPFSSSDEPGFIYAFEVQGMLHCPN